MSGVVTLNTRIIDIGKGEPDFHTPDHIKHAAKAAIDEDFTKYTPQAGIPALREACAAKFHTENGFNVAPDHIVASCGGKHSVENAVRATVRPRDEVILFTPFWFAYPPQVRLAGGVPVLVSLSEADEFRPDIEAIRAAITPRTRLLIINTPNNPTTVVYPRDLLLQLGRLAVEHDFYILSDEVYEKLVFDGAEHISMASLDPEIAARTVTINSVSKTHAMTGWRIGYAALPGDLAEKVVAIQGVTTSAPSAVCQRAALAALTGDQSHVAKMVAAYADRRALVLERLARLEMLHAYPPQGAFYVFISIEDVIGRTIRGRTIGDADDFVVVLRDEARVAINSGVSFGAPHHLRLSFAVAREALEEGFDRIERLLL